MRQCDSAEACCIHSHDGFKKLLLAPRRAAKRSKTPSPSHAPTTRWLRRLEKLSLTPPQSCPARRGGKGERERESEREGGERGGGHNKNEATRARGEVGFAPLDESRQVSAGHVWRSTPYHAHFHLCGCGPSTPLASAAPSARAAGMTLPKRQKLAVLHYYKQQDDASHASLALGKSLSAAGITLKSVSQETCFNVSLTDGDLSASEEKLLHWLFAETFEPTRTQKSTFLSATGAVLEVGPRLAFCTAWSTNAVSICTACGISKIDRIERSRRYLVVTEPQVNSQVLMKHAEALHDRMTECVYETPLSSFAVQEGSKPVVRVPLLKEGRQALQKISDEMGFGFDDADLDYYTDVFTNKLKRDPTDVELFDIGQVRAFQIRPLISPSNSEHSRHWYFGGTIVIDGKAQPQTLFKMVKATLKGKLCNDNSVIAFHDNSSSILGYPVKAIRPTAFESASAFASVDDTYHLILTAETHNFPCGEPRCKRRARAHPWGSG
ncbi:MAG: hypothetical protein SGPRY_004122 [Prymnesium sp.]